MDWQALFTSGGITLGGGIALGLALLIRGWWAHRRGLQVEHREDRRERALELQESDARADAAEARERVLHEALDAALVRARTAEEREAACARRSAAVQEALDRALARAEAAEQREGLLAEQSREMQEEIRRLTGEAVRLSVSLSELQRQLRELQKQAPDRSGDQGAGGAAE